MSKKYAVNKTSLTGLLHYAATWCRELSTTSYLNNNMRSFTLSLGTTLRTVIVTRSSVRQFEVLIWKLPAVDGLSSSPIVVGEISSLKACVWLVREPRQPRMTAGYLKVECIERLYLAHELRDDTVENGSLVAEAMFPCAERSEVLCKTHRLHECMCTGGRLREISGLLVGCNSQITLLLFVLKRSLMETGCLN